MSMIRRLRNRRPEISEESDAATEQTDTEVTAEDSQESDAATEQTDSAVTAEDSQESEAAEEAEAVEPSVVERGPSRLGLGWAAGIAAALVLFAGGVGAGGYLALRAHQQSQTQARSTAAALQAAKDCVAATQAPDTTAASSIDCNGAMR